jgi:hypothetical protein
MPIWQPTDIMLLEELRDAIQESELVLLATQPPDNIACLAVDFGDLIQAAAGDQQVVVIIDLDGIPMHIIDCRSGQVLG